MTKTMKFFKNEVEEYTQEEYTPLGVYKNNHTKVFMKHNDCGYVYEVRPKDFLTGKRKSRCPKCNVIF